MTTDDRRLEAARRPAAEALRLHPFYRGKIQTALKCPVERLEDFSVWYTPGVAAVCKAIVERPESSYEHTNRGNSVAIVSDGTRVLGLGPIGPTAGLPVMEGKALLFKYLGGVDATPLCVATRSIDELARTVELLQPTFGAVNLEDIAQPGCFALLDRLRAIGTIPIWHDDQQGTALVILAALINALRVVDKELGRVRIALVGCGAANVAFYRLLKSQGVDPRSITAVDRRGTLHAGRSDLEERQAAAPDKWRICVESNGDRIAGGAAEALRGADVCVAFSTPGPGVIDPQWIRSMARRAIVFAGANPTPEIWPWEAREAGAAIVATGRSDFPNQVNNSLGFPAVFRGVLDVRAAAITDEMTLAAAQALADLAGPNLGPERIVPRMDEWEIYPRVAAAVGVAAQQAGVARRQADFETLRAEAERTISEARRMTRVLTDQGLIRLPPPLDEPT